VGSERRKERKSKKREEEIPLLLHLKKLDFLTVTLLVEIEDRTTKAGVTTVADVHREQQVQLTLERRNLDVKGCFSFFS